MLNKNNLGNIEVKTPSPLSSSADRSINEDEETLSKSGSSSSAGSSPSDLRERLRHYSSPNQAIQFTNRVINVNRRLSQRRDTYLRDTTERIEEIEEKEEQEPSSSVVEERGARARRRAKLRLQNQKMVVSKPTETHVLDSKSNDNQGSKSSSMIESRSSQSEQRSTLVETLNSPLSGRTLPTLSPYRRKRNGSGNESSRSHPPLLSLYSGASRENSSKNRVDLQLLSPMSLGNARPTRFGGYRPRTGVIVQNLSSGSEPESSHETVFIQRIEHLIPITSPASPNSLPPLSSRRSSVPREASEPSRNEVLAEINFLQGSNDRLMLTPLNSSRTPHDSFYRMGGSSRSMKNTFGGSGRLESSSARTKTESPRSLECGVISSEKVEQTPRNCIDSSRWKNVRTPSTANSLKNSMFKNPHSEEDQTRQDNYKCIEAEETETSSVASVFKELFDEKFPGQPKEDISSQESRTNITPNSIVYRQKFTNVPTLALNSQEVSCVTSPAAKASSEKRLDTDALMAALSNVSLKQQTANEASVNVCSKYSSENNFPTSRSRFNGSEMSYGSSFNRKSKIPVKVPTNRSAFQDVSSSPEGLQTYSERNDEESSRAKNDAASNFENIQLLSKECQVESDRTAELSQFRESLSAVKHYFGESISPTSDWSTNDTSRDQNKHFESENSERMNLELKDVRSKSCLTPLQIPSDDDRADDNEDTQNETYRVNTKTSNESLVEPKKEDTCDTLNSSDNQSEHQKVDEDHWKSDLEESSGESKHHRTKCTNTYEGEVCDETAEEKRITLTENQIGDGGCQETSPESSPEDEEFAKGKKVARHRDKFRFSMERLAAEQLRRNISSEQSTITYFTEKMYEAAQHASSTSKLHYGYERTRDSPRFRKSQDRFPFTISEKTSVSSVKFKHPGRLTNMEQSKKSPERSYHLVAHPSITRLANSGFEDTPADIIDYVTRTEQADREVKFYGMKGLVQRFSARLRRSKKLDQVKPDRNATNVIYENHAYREEHESLTGSCSESSLLKELRMCGGMGDPRCANGDSPDENSSVVSGKKSPERPYRRYDRDDLWVRAFEKSAPGSARRKEIAETRKELDECKSVKDPYSVFFVKSAGGTSAREFLPENEGKRPVSVERRDRVKFRDSSLAVVPKKSDEGVSARNRKFENIKRNRNVGNGCLCLQFYRMIVPVSFRSVSKHRPRDNRISVKKKSRFSLQRKKG